jgi:hypothetical protein
MEMCKYEDSMRPHKVLSTEQLPSSSSSMEPSKKIKAEPVCLEKAHFVAVRITSAIKRRDSIMCYARGKTNLLAEIYNPR